MKNTNIKPDFGTFYVKVFGKETVYINTGLIVFQIAYIDENLYSSTCNILYENKEYCMTIDYDIKCLMQLINFEGDEKFKEELVDKLFNNFNGVLDVKLQNKPIEVIVEAFPDQTFKNKNETYTTFRATTFSKPRLIKSAQKSSLPKEFTHVLMFEDNPNGFAIEIKSKKKKKEDPNILDCTACYAGMGEMCESGSMYVFESIEDAKNSIAWQIMGGFNYAVPLDKLNEQQKEASEQLWLNYKDDFEYGFRKRGISLSV